jgi:hypothetical protein
MLILIEFLKESKEVSNPKDSPQLVMDFFKGVPHRGAIKKHEADILRISKRM